MRATFEKNCSTLLLDSQQDGPQTSQYVPESLGYKAKALFTSTELESKV